MISASRRVPPSRMQILPPRPNASRIARRAYERYEARGRQHGHDMDDWFEAERELRQSVSSDTTPQKDEDVNSDEAA